MIHLKNIKKSYSGVEVLKGISLDVPKGEQLVIKGASGSGKSTLLYLIGGLDQSDSGVVNVNGTDLLRLGEQELAQYRNREVGFIFQFHFLLPSMKCLDNILLPAKIAAKPLPAIKERVLEIAQYLDVEKCLGKYPFQISGGEQQRINIIRALSLRPKLLLCDEPTGNLDSKNSTNVTTLLKSLAKELETTMVIVTHDDKVATSFQRTVHMEDGLLRIS